MFGKFHGDTEFTPLSDEKFEKIDGKVHMVNVKDGMYALYADNMEMYHDFLNKSEIFTNL